VDVPSLLGHGNNGARLMSRLSRLKNEYNEAKYVEVAKGKTSDMSTDPLSVLAQRSYSS